MARDTRLGFTLQRSSDILLYRDEPSTAGRLFAWRSFEYRKYVSITYALEEESRVQGVPKAVEQTQGRQRQGQVGCVSLARYLHERDAVNLEPAKQLESSLCDHRRVVAGDNRGRLSDRGSNKQCKLPVGQGSKQQDAGRNHGAGDSTGIVALDTRTRTRRSRVEVQACCVRNGYARLPRI